MTAKDKNNKDELQQQLEEAQNHAHQKEENTVIEELQKKINDLEKTIEEKAEIAKKAQYDYITLKMDFDGYIKRKQENETQEKLEILFSVIKKILPFIESLRKSIETIPSSEHEDPMVKGIILTYNKFLSTLETMGIKPIEAMGLEPNNELHEPVSMLPTEDQDLKGKIIQEFEKGFIYEKDGIKKVISTAKVVIGQ